MEAGIDEVRAQTIDAEQIAGGVDEREAAVVKAAEILGDAEIRREREVAGVLVDLGRAIGKDEVEAHGGDGAGRLIAYEREFGAEVDFGETVAGFDPLLRIGNIAPDPAEA